MKTLLVLVGVFLALSQGAALGSGSTSSTSLPPHENSPTSPQTPEESARVDMRYLTLAPVLISVIRHNDVHKLVQLMVTLELTNAKDRSRVEWQMPRLRDAYISDLTRIFGLGLYDNRTVDLALVKRRMVAASVRILGEGVIRDVLILNALERGV